jgi:hypothetical protein
MKKHHIFLLLIVSLLSVTLSCTKNAPANKDLLVGSWVAGTYRTDLNNNGIIDSNEMAYAYPGGEVVTFHSDGSFADDYSGSAIHQAGTWSLGNSDKSLTMTLPIGHYGGPGTATYQLTKLTSSQLTLYYSGSYSGWMTYTKQ